MIAVMLGSCSNIGAVVVGVDADEAAVEAAHGAPLVAPQLLDEARDLDPQVGPLEPFLGEAGVARQLRRRRRRGWRRRAGCPGRAPRKYSPSANVSTSSSTARSGFCWRSAGSFWWYQAVAV